MKKILLFLSILALTASCKAIMEPVRVQLPGTYWSYATDDATANICFPDDTRIIVLQLSIDACAVEALHGTYTTDGHRVEANGDDWGRTIKFVRTFSHLKNNSTNKDMTPVYPAASQLKGSVWGTIENQNLHVAYFSEDNCFDATFKHIAREEGQDYGWEWNQKDYTVNGNQLEAGSFKATLFDTFMIVDGTYGVFSVAPAVDQAGSSALKGTVWATEDESTQLPALVVFTSSSKFVRIVTYSKTIFKYTSGTYDLQGTSLSLKWDDIEETCQIEGGRFTLFKDTVNSQTFSKVTLP